MSSCAVAGARREKATEESKEGSKGNSKTSSEERKTLSQSRFAV